MIRKGSYVRNTMYYPHKYGQVRDIVYGGIHDDHMVKVVYFDHPDSYRWEWRGELETVSEEVIALMALGAQEKDVGSDPAG